MIPKDRFAPIIEVVSELSKQLEPLNRKHITEFSFIVAHSHLEAAEKFAEGETFPNEDYETKKEFIDDFLKDPQKGVYNPKFSRVIIDLQTIEEIHKGDVKAQNACVAATTLHELLHHISGMELDHRFGQHRYNITWFVEGTNELITRRLFRTAYPKEVSNLTCESYLDIVSLAEKISAIIGEDVLFRAYLNGQFHAIVTALGKEGVTTEEIKTLLQLGHQMLTTSDTTGRTGAEIYKKLSNHLDRLERRIRKQKARKEIEENEEKSCIDRYDQAYGPLGAAAKPGLDSWRQMPAGKRQRLLQPVIPQPFASQASSLDELKEQMKAIPGYSGFLADMAIGLASAHLRLETGRAPSAADVGRALEESASSFSSIYTGQPTMRQLAYEVARDVFHVHSHSIPVSEFMGVDRAAIKVPKELPEEPEKLAELLGIKGNMELLIGGASLMQGICNNEPSVTNVVEAILCAKKLLRQAVDAGTLATAFALNDVGTELFAGAGTMQAGKKIPGDSARKYLDIHYPGYHAEADEKAISRISELLGLAYPASFFHFHPKTGFTRFTIDLSEEGQRIILPDPPGNGGRGSMGKFNPYGVDFAELFKKHGLEPVNPLAEGQKVAAARMKRTGFTEFAGYAALFDEYATDGRAGLKFDAESERPTGFLTPEEVLERGYALCLEHAYLVLALNQDRRAFAFKVFRDEEDGLIPHISTGVFFEETSSDIDIMRKAGATHLKPRIPYYLFDHDPEFRDSLLKELGLGARQDTRFALLDFSMANFGAQYGEIRPMSRAEDLLSAYFVNRGVYKMHRKLEKEALADFETALRINEADELARSHLVAYFADIEPNRQKVMELTSDFSRLVNTEDLVSRALAMISLGNTADALKALLAAVQLSENAVKARALIRQMLS